MSRDDLEKSVFTLGFFYLNNLENNLDGLNKLYNLLIEL